MLQSTGLWSSSEELRGRLPLVESLDLSIGPQNGDKECVTLQCAVDWSFQFSRVIQFDMDGCCTLYILADNKQ